MFNVVRRFVKEAILREELKKYGAMYSLNDGNYYHIIVSAYSHNEARRTILRNPSNASFHVFQPSDVYKQIIRDSKGIYVYYIGKDED